MSKWFGSSGIRGSFNELNPEFALKLGKAVGQTYQNSNPIYIASDIRYTSDVLKSAFMSGYSAISGQIIDIGLNPTPVLSFVSSIEKTLGVMITASHNPPSNNGFKFFLNGGECNSQFEEEVEKYLGKLVKNQSLKVQKSKSWDNVGKNVHSRNIIHSQAYIDYICKKVSLHNFKTKIILDCANNVPILISPRVLQKLGFKNVITINEEMDASFPGRPSEPAEQNLERLKRVVTEEEAEIGIAHDGDGDRFAIIDEKGSYLSSTSLICVFLDNLDYSNNKNQKIVLTSDCTQQAFEIVSKNGAEAEISRIGRNRDFVNDSNVIFLAEPNKIIFPELGKWIDGLFPVLKLLEISKEEKISNIQSLYDKRKVLRKAFIIGENERNQVSNLIENLPTLWSKEIEKISLIDGLKIFLKDNSSILIRFSGTEPKIKFYIESSSKIKNDAILKRLITKFNLNSPSFDC